MPAPAPISMPKGYQPGDIIDYDANLSDHGFISRVEHDPVAHRLRAAMADRAQVLTFPVVRRLSGSLISMTHRQLMEHMMS